MGNIMVAHPFYNALSLRNLTTGYRTLHKSLQLVFIYPSTPNSISQNPSHTSYIPEY